MPLINGAKKVCSIEISLLFFHNLLLFDTDCELFQNAELQHFNIVVFFSDPASLDFF